MPELRVPPIDEARHRQSDQTEAHDSVVRPEKRAGMLENRGADEAGPGARSDEAERPIEVVPRRLPVGQAAILGVDENLIGASPEPVADHPQRVIDQRHPAPYRREPRKGHPVKTVCPFDRSDCTIAELGRCLFERPARAKNHSAAT